MVRPLEPRVGENRPIEEIRHDAEAFLCEMRDDGMFKSEAEFQNRLRTVLAEIERRAVDTKVYVNHEHAGKDGAVELKSIQVPGRSSSGYVQTKQEMEWGIRAAWRNSRKCIMRAHYKELKYAFFISRYNRCSLIHPQTV